MPRDNDGTMPENHGKPWSRSSENLLLRKISEEESIENISNYFKRTEGGIKARLRELACRFVEDGKTIEEASTYTKISVEDIVSAINQIINKDKIIPIILSVKLKVSIFSFSFNSHLQKGHLSFILLAQSEQYGLEHFLLIQFVSPIGLI